MEIESSDGSLSRNSLISKGKVRLRKSAELPFQILVIGSIQGFEVALLQTIQLALEEATLGGITPLITKARTPIITLSRVA